MANTYFQFKQFTIYHDRCAMKVGTDGVLMGAWVDVEGATRILDVGTGSGLVALMLAQRNPKAVVDALEIDEQAAFQAEENFRKSPFTNIRKCEHCSFKEYVSKSKVKYDLVVSNPPFFSRSLKSPDEQRSLARHNDSLLIEDFISLSRKILAPEGGIAFIFPYIEKDYLISLAAAAGLFVTKIVAVRPTPDAESKRVLIELSPKKVPATWSEIIIETARHEYSPEFVQLVRDFYLKM